MSVKNYLLTKVIRIGTSVSSKLSEESSNAALAEVTIAYLLQFDNGHFFRENEFLVSELLKERPASKYAAEYWAEHLRAAEEQVPGCLPVKLFSNDWVFKNVLHLDSSHYLRNYCHGIGESQSKLAYASGLGLLDVCQYLLDAGQSKDGWALSEAVSEGHENIVKLLLDYGADPNTVTEYKTSPLEIATTSGYETIAHSLIEAGTRVNLGNALISAAQCGMLSIVESLLSLGVCVNEKRQEGMEEVDDDPSGTVGRSALHEAAWAGHGKIVTTLLQHRADIDATYNCGDTALHDAVRNGQYDVVKILVDAGAKTDVVVHGQSPFTLAEKGGRHEILQLLKG